MDKVILELVEEGARIQFQIWICPEHSGHKVRWVFGLILNRYLHMQLMLSILIMKQDAIF